MKSVLCATYDGVDAKVIYVESSITKGLPSFSIVGMASVAISEAKERCKSALLNNDFKFPPKRITINLSPSDFKKEGSQFDLSIALLIALDEIEDDLDGWFVFGELGLDGEVKENEKLYPLILSLANQNLIKKAIVPKGALPKLSKIPNVDFYGVSTLKESIAFFKKELELHASQKSFIEYPFCEANGVKYFYDENYKENFKDVKGQEVAKRASIISACGFHNILLNGSPGCGKSMIAKRLRYILPPMSDDEILELAKLDSLESKEPSFRPLRKFRSPHHSSTLASIFGGGSQKAKIGEVGLSHNSILFFDELPHFSKQVLEALREPLQDYYISISRVHSKVLYPAKFLFVGAMNPCPCGNLLDSSKECRCNELEIKRYKNKLSEPFLDRIDLHVDMQKVTMNDKSTIDSKQMHKMVIEGFLFAKSRGQKEFNGKLSDEDIDKFCIMDDEAKDVLQMAIQNFSLSFRSIKSIQKVSRTIADLDKSRFIQKKHLLEALSYRRRV